MWEFTGELFEMNEVDETLMKHGVAVNLDELKPKWEKEISALLEQASIKKPESTYMQKGSRKGLHGEHLSYILAEMQSLPRMHPEAKW
jgi:ring-1,2-phenylacetyl-CoA epoxidase subunit PaaC